MLPSESRIYEIFQQFQHDPQYQSVWSTYSHSFDALLTLIDSLDDAQGCIIQDYIDAFFAVHWEMMLFALDKNK